MRYGGSAVERLASLLADIRYIRMQEALDRETERRAAEKLIEWYDWEVDSGRP